MVHVVSLLQRQHVLPFHYADGVSANAEMRNVRKRRVEFKLRHTHARTDVAATTPNRRDFSCLHPRRWRHQRVWLRFRGGRLRGAFIPEHLDGHLQARGLHGAHLLLPFRELLKLRRGENRRRPIGVRLLRLLHLF